MGNTIHLRTSSRFGAIVSFASLAIPLIDPLGVILGHLAFASGGFVLVRENVANEVIPSPVSQVPSLP